MPKKTFTTDTTAAAELFNAHTPAPAADQAQAAPMTTPATTPTRKANVSAPLFTWKARPDGERRDRRLQIICKSSIAQKAAEVAKARGISVAYLFELLILEEWQKENPQA